MNQAQRIQLNTIINKNAAGLIAISEFAIDKKHKIHIL